MIEFLQQLDQQLLLSINSCRTPFWDSFMWIFSGKMTWVPMYAAILYVILRNFKLSVGFYLVVVIALTILFTDQVCASWIRPWVERMRPSNLNNPVSEFIHIVNGKRGGRYGFPSCHAANSFGLAFLFLFFRRGPVTVFMLLWAAVNSYSRVYLGVHYPGDLLAGMVVALAGASLLFFLSRFFLKQPRVAGFLHYSGNVRERLEGRKPIEQKNVILYAGLLTIVLFTVYSLY